MRKKNEDEIRKQLKELDSLQKKNFRDGQQKENFV